MKSVLVGSVRSSTTVLKKMIETGFPINMVFSLDEQYAGNVSGYKPIHKIAEANGIPYKKFKKISDSENLQIIKEIEPDYIFVIGLSQLIPKEMIELAKIGCVGFHPTPLPKFRGRAAVVWQILLGVHATKCSLFIIDKGIDSGDILGQAEYYISDDDYIEDVSFKLNAALGKLCDKVFKEMIAGTCNPVRQNEDEATYLLIRRPEDGYIDWKQPAEKVQRLVRAISKPYPGAFGLYDGEHKIIIWRAEYLDNKKYIGLPGQICNIQEDFFDVLCAKGILRVTEFKNEDNVKMLVGHKLK